MRLRRPGSKRSLIIALGTFGALAAAGVIGGIAASGGFSGSASLPPMPTTGDYAPISIPAPVTGAIADPDSMARQGQELATTLTPGRTPHEFRVTVTNTSTIGFVNSFYWVPPSGMTLIKVVGSNSGHCIVDGSPTPKISCDGLKLKPPTCTCRGDGGELVISFLASKDPGMLAGSSAVVSATPVLKVIPAVPPGPDVRPCSNGEKSTAAEPCAAA
jgi:hypothetical protein